MFSFIYLTLAFLLIVSSYTDLKSRLIPNWLVLAVLGLGLVQVGLDLENVVSYGWSFLVGLLVWGGLFHFRLMGGGDAKLMIALSVWVLLPELLTLYLCVAIAGGVQAGIWFLLKKERELPYGVAISLGSVLFFIMNKPGLW